MKIRAKLIVSLSALTATIVFIGILGIYSVNKLSSQNKIYSSTKEASAKMLAARLSQADFMLLEQEQFKSKVNVYLKESIANLNDVKASMQVPESIETVETIIGLTKQYEKAFSDLIISKQEDIKGKASFDESASQVSLRIDTVLQSIENFYSQNQSDFEEFSRYRSAKSFKDLFNDTRVLVWKYNNQSDSELVDNIEANIERLSNMVVSLKRIMKGAETLQRLSELEQDLQSYKLLFVYVKTANDNLSTITKGLIDTATQVSNLTNDLLKVELEIASSVQQSITIFIIIALVLSIASSTALGLWLSKSILVGLNKSMSLAEAITHGDLSKTEKAVGNDEFGILINAMNGSSTKLKEIVTQIKGALAHLSTSSSNVDSAVQKTTNSTQNQRAETENLATAILELSTANEQIADSAARASETSKSAEEKAKTGDSIVLNATSAMQELSSELAQASLVVDKLNQDSINIADILSVIRSIAEQTNLLALNAAIEAARAGEQGRGFAVVADEVRTLAGRTQNSVQEITNIIELIQKGAGDVVIAMESSNNKSIDVVKLTESASEAYASITESIKHVLQINMQVALGASEQAKVTQETSVNVEKIKTLADDNTSSVSEIGAQVDKQIQQTQQLHDLVGFFKT